MPSKLIRRYLISKPSVKPILEFRLLSAKVKKGKENQSITKTEQS